MPYLQKFCFYQKFRKKNGPNFQGFKVSCPVNNTIIFAKQAGVLIIV